MMQWKEIPAWEKPFTYHSHGSRCHWILSGTNTGSHQFGLLETPAQMCCSSSRDSTHSVTWQPGQDGQHRPGMLSCLPERCLNINMLWKKILFQAGLQKFLSRPWICVYDCPLLQLFHQHTGLDQFLPLYSEQPCPSTSAWLPQNTGGNEYLPNLPWPEDKSEALSRA